MDHLGKVDSNHPHPYKLSWLNDCGEISVRKQVLVSFTIGGYKDKILCDIGPMHASHILLGRLWQYDRKVTYDGYLNRYSFRLNGKSFELHALPPYKVLEDQAMMHRARSERKERLIRNFWKEWKGIRNDKSLRERR